MPGTTAAGPGSAAEHVSSALCLPADVLRRCFEHLAHDELVTASAVSREWRQVARCDLLWKNRLQSDFSISPNLVGSRSGSSSLGCPAARLYPTPEPAAGIPLTSSWRQGYQDHMEVEANWRVGRCSWERLTGHQDYIRCAQLQGMRLATCSGSYMQADCSIRLWDVLSGACLEHMPCEEGPIWSMHFDGRRIASCGDEGCVRLWDLGTHRAGVSGALASGPVKCVGMDECQLAAGNESGVLALWSLDAIQQALEEAPEAIEEDEMDANDSSYELERLPAWQEVQLDGDAGVQPSSARAPQLADTNSVAGIDCLQLDGGLCATGGGQLVHLWSTADDELQPLRVLSGHKGCDSGLLVTGCVSGTVRVWDMDSGALLHDLEAHGASVLCHQHSGSLLATGGADDSVRLWDLRSGREQHMDDRRLVVGCGNGAVYVVDLRAGGKLQPRAVLPMHSERVWAVALSETRLISASLDTTIAVRCFLPESQRHAGSWPRRGLQRDWTHDPGSRIHDDDGDASSGSGSELVDSAYASSDAEGGMSLGEEEGGWSDGNGSEPDAEEASGAW